MFNYVDIWVKIACSPKSLILLKDFFKMFLLMFLEIWGFHWDLSQLLWGRLKIIPSLLLSALLSVWCRRFGKRFRHRFDISYILIKLQFDFTSRHHKFLASNLPTLIDKQEFIILLPFNITSLTLNLNFSFIFRIFHSNSFQMKV